jgi:transposase
MFYIGIDVAKKNHVASVVSAGGENIIKPFPFTNDSDGFAKLLSNLEHLDKSKVLVGLESTAHYGENLISHLFELGYQIALINPIQTANLRKTNIRNAKTDSIDSNLICKALSLGYYRIFSQQDNDTLTLKYLCRFRQKLMKARTTDKIQLVTYVDLLFPELQYFFKSGIHGKGAYALLKKHSSPRQIANLHLTYLANLLKSNSRGHFGKSTAISLRELAKRSVGLKNDVLPIQITQTIAQIELFDSQIQEVDKSVADVMQSLNSPIVSIPGIGLLNGAMILGEIGDIHRFPTHKQLIAFCGLDPTINQSGSFNAKRTRMSKRGSGLLRFAMINAAWNVSLNNKTFENYYQSKMAQGRSHYAALGHVAGKLARTIHKLLTHDIPFDASKAI